MSSSDNRIIKDAKISASPIVIVMHDFADLTGIEAESIESVEDVDNSSAEEEAGQPSLEAKPRLDEELVQEVYGVGGGCQSPPDPGGAIEVLLEKGKQAEDGSQAEYRMEEGIQPYGLLGCQLEEAGNCPVADIDKGHDDEQRRPDACRWLPAPCGEPLAVPGPGAKEEIDEIQGYAGRLQHQYIERMNPHAIGQYGIYKTDARRAGQCDQYEEYDRWFARGNLLFYTGEKLCEYSQQQIEGHESTQIPVLSLLVGSAPEQGGVEGPEVHRNIAAGNHEVGNYRCDEDCSYAPGNADTNQLAFPEGVLALFCQ